MLVTFHGVRGSTPSPGTGFPGVGEHTSCVSTTADGEHAAIARSLATPELEVVVARENLNLQLSAPRRR